MSTGIHVLLIDSHDRDRQYYAILEATTGRAGLDLYQTHLNRLCSA